MISHRTDDLRIVHPRATGAGEILCLNPLLQKARCAQVDQMPKWQDPTNYRGDGLLAALPRYAMPRPFILTLSKAMTICCCLVPARAGL